MATKPALSEVECMGSVEAFSCSGGRVRPQILGSARVSRAGDGVLAIANFSSTRWNVLSSRVVNQRRANITGAA